MEIKYSHHSFNYPYKQCRTKSRGKSHAELKEADQFSERDVANTGLNRRERIDDNSNAFFYPFD